MNTPQRLRLWLIALFLCISLPPPAFSAGQNQAPGKVKLDIRLRYAVGAPGLQTARWWSAIDSTFVYWFQEHGYDYHLTAYDSALSYLNPRHQWQGLEDWATYNGKQPGVYTPGAPISRVKISIWDADGNEHLLITNKDGWATLCGKIGEAYDIGIHSRELQQVGSNAVIAGVAFENLVLTERGLTVEIIIPSDAAAPAVHLQEGAGPCCGTGVFYEGPGQSPQSKPQNVIIPAAVQASDRQTASNATEKRFKLSIRLVQEEGATVPGVTTTNWWSSPARTFLYWFPNSRSGYRFTTLAEPPPYLKSAHHWQGISGRTGNGSRPPARSPGAPLSKVEVSVWDSQGNERVLATDANGWATFCGLAGELYDAGVNSSEVDSAVGRVVIAGVALEDIELQEGGTIVEAIFSASATAPTLRVIQGGGVCCGAGVIPWAGGAAPGTVGAAGAVVGGGPALGVCLAGNLGCGGAAGGDPGGEVMSGVQ